MWCYIFLAVFLGWAVFILRFMHNLFTKKLKYLESPDPNIDEKYKPFERIDRHKWNLPEMYFCSVFLLPFRIITTVGLLTLLVCIVNLVAKFSKDIAQEQNPLHRNIIKFSINFVSRAILFSFGIYRIEREYLKISDFDHEYPQSHNSRQENAPIIVANHVSFLDIIYNTSSDLFPSFLSKVEVKDFMFFGACARGIQSIFVDRSSREDKDSVKDALKLRGKLINEGKRYPPILIFPEGTTSNGKYLISFKRGAFEPLLPIKIICTQYKIRHLNITLDALSQGVNFLLGMSQFKNNLKILEFNTYYPDHLKLSSDRENDWEIYARKIKNIMLKALKAQNSESGYTNMKEYEKMLKIRYGKGSKENLQSTAESQEETKKQN